MARCRLCDDLFSIAPFGVLLEVLSDGILGADANWTANANVPATLGGNVTIQTADSSGTTHTITLNGALSGTGGFTETGRGSLHLNDTSTYTGPTVISAGSLVVGSTSTLGLPFRLSLHG